LTVNLFTPVETRIQKVDESVLNEEKRH
jgi:hypothetical protein